jgi:phosphoribosyl 1,2-cyclic phosphodiesterase
MSGFTVNVLGCRGSVPVSGAKFLRYGGATTCFEIEISPTERLLIDAGTGAMAMHDRLPKGEPLQFSILLTHLHWDHCLALPFFKPLYHPDNRFTFYGREVGGMDIEEAIDRVMRPPWFPVNFRGTAAKKQFREVTEEPMWIDGFEIIPRVLHHPDGVAAYRIQRDGKAIVIATDVEHGQAGADEKLLALAGGADVLVYDAQYLPEEYLTEKEGWGHSTWLEAVSLAKRAGVGQLVLTSHDPSRTDDGVNAIVDLAQAVFPETHAAFEGMEIRVG